MDEAQIKRMVDRFLGWKLPESFNPDGGISFKRMRNENTPWPAKNEPVGTNLFDATQAEEMVRYMLADAHGSVTEQSQQKSRQAHEEWERKLASAQTEVASEMKKRLEGLFITLGIGDYPGDWWAAMEKMAEAIRAQKHLATFASERYDKILELERRLADAQGSVTEQSQQKSRQDGEA